MNLAVLFAIEGLLLQFTQSINNFGNNLFATNLGATDSQIGLIQVIPNIIALILLLPFGIWTDKAKNIKTPERSVAKKESITLRAVANTFVRLAHNKQFMLFYIPIIFFYMTWQMDWSMWYIGQLIAIGVLSKQVQKDPASWRTLPVSESKKRSFLTPLPATAEKMIWMSQHPEWLWKHQKQFRHEDRYLR